MTIELWILSAAVCAGVGYPILYWCGLAVSRGYHRGKREFVQEIVSDSAGNQKGEQDGKRP